MATLEKQKKKAVEDVLATEQRAFRRKFAQLHERYKGKYVAFYKGRLVGTGTDDEKLALQMYGKLGDVPFFIAKVDREPTIYELPSPEVVS
jgi:uncharacterized protein YwqG